MSIDWFGSHLIDIASPLRVEFAGTLHHITYPGDRHGAFYEGDEVRAVIVQDLATFMYDSVGC